MSVGLTGSLEQRWMQLESALRRLENTGEPDPKAAGRAAKRAREETTAAERALPSRSTHPSGSHEKNV